MLEAKRVVEQERQEGLFKNVFGSSSFPATEPEAVLGILLSVIAADGDRCKGLLRREGPHALMDRCAPMVTPQRRMPLFINACELIMRDGRVRTEEDALVDASAQAVVSLVLAKYSL